MSMSVPVRVMSFNVRTATAEDGPDNWEHRKELVASVIRFHRPDVVGLQEPLARQVEYLEGELPAYDWVGVGRKDGNQEGEFVPIFYRQDRFEGRESDAFWLSEVPDDPGSVGWSAEHPRIATRVELTDRESGTTFTHFNTHLSHVDDRARIEAAKLLRKRTAAVEGPVVLTGDFNCGPDSEPYRVLTGTASRNELSSTLPAEPLADARAVATHLPLGPTATKHEFDGRVTERIDYVFVRGLSVLLYGALSDHWDGRWPSDHLPVVAELEPGERL